MSIEVPPVMIGVYEDEAQAKNALHKLKQASFGEDKLTMLVRNGGLIPLQIVDALVRAGLPQDQAAACQNEYEAGHIILLVKHDGRIQEAFTSLYEIRFTNVTVTHAEQPGEAPASGQESVTSENPGNDVDEALWQLLKREGLDHLL